jgi:hypothetical protein
VCIVNINVVGNESGANCHGRAPTGSVGCKTVYYYIIFYDTGAILIYEMLREQTDKHLTRKNYKNLIFKAIKA